MWRLTTLGGLALAPLDRAVPAGADCADAPADALAQRRPLAVLAVLAASGERGVPRDRLLLYFWPESDTEHARNALKQTLFRLRRDLAAPELVLGATDLRLNPTVVASDVADFEAALGAGDLERAVALYCGPFLHGIASGRLPEFDEWAAAERARLAMRFAAAVESLASAAEARGDHRTAVAWWRRLAATDPTSSRVALGLMAALDAAGDHEGALQYFRLHELLLREELGIEPDETVVALVHRLRGGGRTSPPSLGGDPAAPDTTAIAHEPPRRARDDDTVAAPGRTPEPTPAPTPWVTPTTPTVVPRRRHRFPAAAGAVVLLGAVSLGLVLRARAVERAGAVEAATPTVAVLPFSVHAAGGSASASSADYLREGLVDLLSRNLDGAGSLRAADPHAVLGLVRRDSAGGRAPDPQLAGDVAGRLGASHIVLGDVSAAGGRLRIAATIYHRAPGTDALRRVGRADAEGDTARVFELVDRLTLGLLAAFPRRDAGRLARTAALTTTSLPALKAYLTGETLYRERRWTDALEAFQQAVRADTGFALAHYRLSAAADWAGQAQFVIPAAERAYRMSGRLGTHERLLVRAHRAFRRGEAAEAEHLYREVVASHPDDLEAWYQLGEVRFHLGPMRGRSVTEARAPFTHVLRLDPGNEEALLHLLRIAAREGQRAVVDTLSRRVLALGRPHHDLEVRAFRALTIGTTAEAEEALRALRQGRDLDLYATTWRVAVFGRELDAAARVAAMMAEPGHAPNTRLFAREIRGDILIARGRRRAADVELVELALVDPPYSRWYALALRALFAVIPVVERSPAELRQLLAELQRADAALRSDGRRDDPYLAGALYTAYSLGIVHAALGDSTAARAAARRVAAWTAHRDDSAGVRGRSANPMAGGILAQVAWRAGRTDEALALLQPVAEGRAAGESYTQGLDHFTLAELLRARGRHDEALGWYGSIADASYQNVPFLGLAELRQAQIHDARGDRARAVAHYRRFVALWRGCDPELRPLVAEAERRIGALAPS